MRGLIVVLVTALAPGCYLAHEGDAASGDHANDAGVVRSDPDATGAMDASSELVDAAVPTSDDAGPLLPPEPDPDHGDDARPSDYVDAGDWGAPPMLGPDDPCCTLGGPIRVAGRPDIALTLDAPHIAWGPGRWGIAIESLSGAADMRAVAFLLEPEGTPIGGPHVLDPQTGRTGGIVWAEGRWAIAIGGGAGAAMGRSERWLTRLFDRDLRPATDWIDVGDGDDVALAELTTGHDWLAIRNGTSVDITPFTETDGAGGPVGEPFTSPSGIDAVGMRSRAAILLGGTGTPSSVAIVGTAPAFAVLGDVTLSAPLDVQSAIGSLRDLVVVAGVRGDTAFAQVVDPFASSLVGTEAALGPAAPGVARGVDVAGSNKSGVAGVCWVRDSPDSARGMSSIDFRIVGPDGAVLGTAVNVVTGRFRGAEADCAVGSDELGFLVAWWDGDALWVRRIDVGP